MTFISVTEHATGNKRIIRSEDIKSVEFSGRRQVTIIIFTALVPGEQYNEALFVKEAVEEIEKQLK
jgi:hypothetical protein